MVCGRSANWCNRYTPRFLRLRLHRAILYGYSGHVFGVHAYRWNNSIATASHMSTLYEM